MAVGSRMSKSFRSGRTCIIRNHASSITETPVRNPVGCAPLPVATRTTVELLPNSTVLWKSMDAPLPTVTLVKNAESTAPVKVTEVVA